MIAEIHPALLDDALSIAILFRSRISRWQRVGADGRAEDVDYRALTLYQRWLHGGAWMSLETGAIHLNHLLAGAGMPIVARDRGRVVGYAEAYVGNEAPYGNVVHIAQLVTSEKVDQAAVSDMLIDHFVTHAKTLRNAQVTIARAGEDDLSEAAARRSSLDVIGCVKRFSLSARTGQVFYRAVEHTSPDAAQINGWMMPVGRLTSSREMWERLMPLHWETIPEIRARRTHRLKFSAAGQDAFLICQQGLYNPRTVEIYCWTAKALTSQLVSSIRDWAHRENYRTLSLLIADDAIKALGTEAEADGYTQETCALELG